VYSRRIGTKTLEVLFLTPRSSGYCNAEIDFRSYLDMFDLNEGLKRVMNGSLGLLIFLMANTILLALLLYCVFKSFNVYSFMKKLSTFSRLGVKRVCNRTIYNRTKGTQTSTWRVL